MPMEKSISTELVPNEKSLKCKRCGRKLKNPESIELGFGVICYEKYKKRQKLIPLFTMPKKAEEDEMDAKLAKEVERLNNKVTSLKKSVLVKEQVISELVKQIVPDGPDATTKRTQLVKDLLSKVKKQK